MWAKLSFRIKITIIYSVALIVLTVALTALSLMNVRQNISNPMELSIIQFENLTPGTGLIFSDDSDSIVSFPDMLDLEGMSLFGGAGAPYFPTADMEQLLRENAGTVSVIPIAQLQEQLSNTQRDFRHYSLWIAGIIILLGTLGAYAVAGVVMRPIRKLSSSVENIKADKLHVSLPLPKSQDEIAQLTASFNGMLDKLQSARL